MATIPYTNDNRMDAIIYICSQWEDGEVKSDSAVDQIRDIVELPPAFRIKETSCQPRPQEPSPFTT